MPVLRLSSASRCPQAVQVLLAGNQRSTTIRCRPSLAVLYSIIWRKCPTRSRRWPWPANGSGPCSHGQVLDHDHVVVADQGRARCGAGSQSGRRELSGARERPSPWPWRGSRSLSGSGRACAGSGPERVPAGELPRVEDILPVAGHSEVLDAEVHAHDGARRGQLLRVGDLDSEGDVPASARVTGDGHRGRVEPGRVDVRPRPHENQRGRGLRQPQRAVLHAERRTGIGRGLAPLAGLEPGVAGAPAKNACGTRCAGAAGPAGAEPTTPRSAIPGSGVFFIAVSAASVCA